MKRSMELGVPEQDLKPDVGDLYREQTIVSVPIHNTNDLYRALASDIWWYFAGHRGGQNEFRRPRWSRLTCLASGSCDCGFQTHACNRVAGSGANVVFAPCFARIVCFLAPLRGQMAGTTPALRLSGGKGIVRLRLALKSRKVLFQQWFGGFCMSELLHGRVEERHLRRADGGPMHRQQPVI